MTNNCQYKLFFIYLFILIISKREMNYEQSFYNFNY